MKDINDPEEEYSIYNDGYTDGFGYFIDNESRSYARRSYYSKQDLFIDARNLFSDKKISSKRCIELIKGIMELQIPNISEEALRESLGYEDMVPEKRISLDKEFLEEVHGYVSKMRKFVEMDSIKKNNEEMPALVCFGDVDPPYVCICFEEDKNLIMSKNFYSRNSVKKFIFSKFRIWSHANIERLEHEVDQYCNYFPLYTKQEEVWRN